MGTLISAYIVPHPPIVVPEVGGAEGSGACRTRESLEEVARRIAADRPDTLILTSPHAPFYRDYLCVSLGDTLEGDFSRFGAPQVHLSFKNNLHMARNIIRGAEDMGVAAGGPPAGQEVLDHGALVPLYFLARTLPRVRLVHLSTPALPLNRLHSLGRMIRQVVEHHPGRTVLMASGDLSHRLTPDAPAGYRPEAAAFDEKIRRILASDNLRELTGLSESELEKAGECGTRSLVMLAGAMDGLDILPEIFSYEGPFGVGYLTGAMNIRPAGDPLVQLARDALEARVLEGSVPELPAWARELPDPPAGVFVCLKKQGRLRGCIGTLGPTRESLAEEVRENAVSAGLRDPRFSPVRPEELPELTYTVDVLGSPESVEGPGDLDPGQYGVIVSSGGRRGVLLPDLEGVDTPEMQIRIALEKAGISPDEPYRLERFQVIRHRPD